jgi:hypothetical protein
MSGSKEKEPQCPKGGRLSVHLLTPKQVVMEALTCSKQFIIQYCRRADVCMRRGVQAPPLYLS